MNLNKFNLWKRFKSRINPILPWLKTINSFQKLVLVPILVLFNFSALNAELIIIDTTPSTNSVPSETSLPIAKVTSLNESISTSELPSSTNIQTSPSPNLDISDTSATKNRQLASKKLLKKAIVLENEFIRLIVNKGPIDEGRFAIETTLGDPENNDDDYQSLIFGKPIPWTSYSTVFIDDTPYVFGGKNKKIQKRSGSHFNYGKVTSQQNIDEGIETVSSFDSDVEAKQRLSFFRNPSTKIKDTTLIHYTITNNDSVTHNIGFRILLDTKLGQNDAAPFRMGPHAIDSEVQFQSSELQDFWQTFDDLISPNIVAQGTLNLPEEGVIEPDQITLANWGTLVDHPWDIPYEEGRSFVREGEFEHDTSLTLLWNPKPLGPGASFDYKTLYGLGGLSLQPGELSLGLTAPAELISTYKKEILVIGYILNSGGFDSKNTTISLVADDSFKIVEGEQTLNIGKLEVGDTYQSSWKIALTGKNGSGAKKITMIVTSTTLEGNQTSRQIELLPPPQLTSSISVKPRGDNYFSVDYILKNPTRFLLSSIKNSISTSKKVGLPWFELKYKTIESIKPGETKKLNWILKNNHALSKEKVSIRSISDMTLPVVKRSYFTPSKDPLLNWDMSVANTIIQKDSLVNISLTPLTSTSATATYSIDYDPTKLQFMRLSLPINEKMEDIQKNMSYTNQSISIKNQLIKKSTNSWITAHFRAIATGNVIPTFKKNDSVESEILIKIIPLKGN
ncbi:hypothetical protein HOG98_06085 [bacterium]|mgnify:CR=1 FL=1|jgi:hypothetical protein|nr:hypothetical protein [bacterium]